MVKIQINDPTLEAADLALEKRENARPGRTYLGMSGIGGCERKNYYGFYLAGKEEFTANTLKNFADGHRTEDLIIERLRMVDGLTVIANDPDTNKQIEVGDFGGHFGGHLDGEILGLKQAPKTWHVLECKSVSDKRLAEFRKLKQKVGEKATLEAWSEMYFAQHQLYMLYRGMKRGYIVVASAGGRDWDAVRTNFDKSKAEFYARRAERIIENPDQLPNRISENPDYFICRWCNLTEICHGQKAPDRNCRTCIFSEATENANWRCKKHNKNLTVAEQREGCPDQRYRPAFIKGEVVTVDDEAVTYCLEDGTRWLDSGG